MGKFYTDYLHGIIKSEHQMSESLKSRNIRWGPTHQLLVYADDVNVLDDNMATIKKNTETLIDGSKEVGLEANTEKTKYMLLSRHQNADVLKIWYSSDIWERL
jgi:valyl-tRNA synthetase